jgi:hypothetical protein
MKPLFHPEDETYLESATELDDRFVNAVRPLILEFSERGYSLREIQILMTGTLVELTLEQILTKRSERLKKT